MGHRTVRHSPGGIVAGGELPTHKTILVETDSQKEDRLLKDLDGLKKSILKAASGQESKAVLDADDSFNRLVGLMNGNSKNTMIQVHGMFALGEIGSSESPLKGVACRKILSVVFDKSLEDKPDRNIIISAGVQALGSIASVKSEAAQEAYAGLVKILDEDLEYAASELKKRPAK
ncbi:MAG TPA: hypothetical protein ENN13_01505 [Candidatus Altiarchaeales archaeon]|nr:hypothetical protein [Candidatus Altiarchaeales archaeon]